MILADKIILLRKKNGMSQENLADKLGVSRQSVSKWESAISIPDLDKILDMAKIFGVTTDFLLKDEIEVEEYPDTDEAEVDNRMTVSLESANEFIKSNNRYSKHITIAVILCILSPVALILLGGLSENNYIQENVAVILGLACLFLFVAIAVLLFCYAAFKMKEFEYISKNEFSTEYGVTGLAKEKKKSYEGKYYFLIVIGIILCIISVIPLIICACIDDLLAVYGLVAFFVIVSIGVAFIVFPSCKIGSYTKLLQEGDYSIEKKKNNPLYESISTAYWLIATATYLLWSFITDDWKITWIVWVIAGVLYPALLSIIKLFEKKSTQ